MWEGKVRVVSARQAGARTCFFCFFRQVLPSRGDLRGEKTKAFPPDLSEPAETKKKARSLALKIGIFLFALFLEKLSQKLGAFFLILLILTKVAVVV